MIAFDLMGYLAGAGHGTAGTDLFCDFQPDSPDDVVVLYDETAPVPDESNVYRVDHWGVQVIVRARVLANLRAKILAIHKQLVMFSGTLGGLAVPFILVMQAPASIGRDSKNRLEATAHYIVRAESAGDVHRVVA